LGQPLGKCELLGCWIAGCFPHRPHELTANLSYSIFAIQHFKNGYREGTWVDEWLADVQGAKQKMGGSN
jgi:hypothetical protein